MASNWDTEAKQLTKILPNFVPSLYADRLQCNLNYFHSCVMCAKANCVVFAQLDFLMHVYFHVKIASSP